MRHQNKITEQDSLHHDLEKRSTAELLTWMNEEDQKVAPSVKEIIPAIEQFVEELLPRLEAGGRLFYIGSGTSGRLGIVDASECPPTFGVSADMVVGLISGGDNAIRKAVEFAEDSTTQAWTDLSGFAVSFPDTVVGLSASGSTPFVLHGLMNCKQNNILTACITCNPGSLISQYADHKLEVNVGPEFVTGSTRLKSGTAQKLILNMISTVTMIKLGRVLDNKMVDMQLTNQKLIDRGTQILASKTGLSQEEARNLLLRYGSVREALLSFSKT
jgi:N-acetylmuramic acid 6-phosphate etherase